MLESLVRMSKSHARLLLREKVTILDAVESIILMEFTLGTSLFDNYYPPISTYSQYKNAERELLCSLEINIHTLHTQSYPHVFSSHAKSKHIPHIYNGNGNGTHSSHKSDMKHMHLEEGNELVRNVVNNLNPVFQAVKEEKIPEFEGEGDDKVTLQEGKVNITEEEEILDLLKEFEEEENVDKVEKDISINNEAKSIFSKFSALKGKY